MAPDRIAGFAEQVQACGVRLVNSPREMLGHIDAALVLSLCGKAHRQSAQEFLAAGIPTFIDKPFACSLADALQMVQLAAQNNTVLFHASALYFAEEVQRFRTQQARFGKLYGAITYGPAKRAAGNPGLFHYGVHAVSMLYALLGPGCLHVTNTFSEPAEVVTGYWSDGRIGTVRGTRSGHAAYGFIAFCEAGVIHQSVSARYAYRNLCRMIVQSFTSGVPAVGTETAVEIVRFILAAMESEHHSGRQVALADVT